MAKLNHRVGIGGVDPCTFDDAIGIRENVSIVTTIPRMRCAGFELVNSFGS